MTEVTDAERVRAFPVGDAYRYPLVDKYARTTVSWTTETDKEASRKTPENRKLECWFNDGKGKRAGECF